MYVGHLDSKRRKWVFNIPYGREQAAIFARFLCDLSTLGKVESMIKPDAMRTNADLRNATEQVVLLALSEKYPATIEDYIKAKKINRYEL